MRKRGEWADAFVSGSNGLNSRKESLNSTPRSLGENKDSMVTHDARIP
jgi:hypothetical protein